MLGRSLIHRWTQRSSLQTKWLSRVKRVCRRSAWIVLLCLIPRDACGQMPAAGASDDFPNDRLPTAHFVNSRECALCHSFSKFATAMRDEQNRNVAPFDLWSGSMMAHSAIDPYWRAALSAEVKATPTQREHIEEVCTRCHAPMAAPVRSQTGDTSLAFLRAGHPQATLGRDGVSCTVCHQIRADQLGTEASFTGRFVIGSDNAIYGPHAQPVTMPMQRHVGYTPQQGEQILSSAMCATCHTVITESFDREGRATHDRLHEQSPYLEWRNSIFNDEGEADPATARSCQSCHVPQIDEDGNLISTRLAHNPGGRDFPFLRPRQPYGRHTFAGGNLFMTRLLRDHRRELGIKTPEEAFDRVIRDSRRLLEQQTARLTLSSQHVGANQIAIAVKVENLSGHKLPTAYPSRRAWLELTVRDERQAIIFASGQVNSLGQITDAQGGVLPSELAGGPTQAHFQTISNSSQVQTFETYMADSNHALTFALLRGSRYQKDNRLLPAGWSDTHEHAAATRPQAVGDDPDFLAGSDTVHYQLAQPHGTYFVEARLLFQSLSSRYMAELLEIDTPEIQAFGELYLKADRTPEVVAKASIEIAHRP